MFSDIFSFQQILIKIVQEVVGTNNIKPGFQHLPEIINYENTRSFATADAIGAFARSKYKSLPVKELKREREKVKKLIDSLVSKFTEEEISRKCLDVSFLVALMLEAMGIWAVVYRGTLIYDTKGSSINRFFYYMDDVFSPPENSNARGHSWVFTPSYPVIDITAKFQPVPDYIKNYVPFPVLLEKDGPFSSDLNWYLDLSDPREIVQKKKRIFDSNRKWPEWNKLHCQAHYKSINVDLHYIPMDIAFADRPLESTDSCLTIGGIEPRSFFQEFMAKVR